MIGAVARARVPGCKFDTILTMESKEGWNKSSAWRVLAGDENFSDVSILGANGREVQEQLADVWVHENSELAGYARPTPRRSRRSPVAKRIARGPPTAGLS